MNELLAILRPFHEYLYSISVISRRLLSKNEDVCNGASFTRLEKIPPQAEFEPETDR